jgi:hypothetical protein
VQNFEIKEFPNRELFRGSVGNEGRLLEFKLNVQEDNVSRIEINTDSPACKLEGDPRDLYYEIKNLRVD